MKTPRLNAIVALSCLSLMSPLLPSEAQAAPRKVLVVSTTTGFRHSSIPTAEKVLGELAQESGAFTVEYARVEPNSPEFRTQEGKPDMGKVNEAIKKVLAEKMNPEALKQYDAIVFANTTGELPVPDRQAFLDFIKSGKGFIGMHAAADTFKDYAAYVDMIGGSFRSHGAQVEVDAINNDKECPMCKHLGQSWKVYDEIYLFNNFDASKVHSLLTLDKEPNAKTPGNFPVAWARNYGKGRVFYTSLGHREDIWDDETPANFKRMNSKEVSLAYQQHILSGIKWALGLEKWNPRPVRPVE